MHPKPEEYGDNFILKCGHCNAIQVNGINAHSENLSAMFVQSNRTVSVAMEMKDLHVGVSN